MDDIRREGDYMYAAFGDHWATYMTNTYDSPMERVYKRGGIVTGPLSAIQGERWMQSQRRVCDGVCGPQKIAA